MKALILILFIGLGLNSTAAGGYWRVKMNYTIDGVEKYGDCLLDYMHADSVDYLKNNDEAFLNYISRHTYDGALQFYQVIRYRGMPEVKYFPLWNTMYEVEVAKIEKASFIDLEVVSWGYRMLSNLKLKEDEAWLKSKCTKLDYDEPNDGPGCTYMAYDHGCHPYGRALYKLFLTVDYQETEKREYLIELMRQHRIVVISMCQC